MARKSDVHVGDRVTCRHAEEASYSNYYDNPECFFEPGDTGIVKYVDVPDVTRNASHVRVSFYKEGIPYGGERNYPWAVDLDYSNIRVLKD